MPFGWRSTLLKYVVVGIGGCLGSILRFWLGNYVGSKMGTRFPYGTFVINITGSFLIGLVFAFLTERSEWSPYWRYLIPIGFIGGYTTFSSFEFETLGRAYCGKSAALRSDTSTYAIRQTRGGISGRKEGTVTSGGQRAHIGTW